MTNDERIPKLEIRWDLVQLPSALRTGRSLLLALLSLVLLASGCAGYKLGPTNGLAAGEKSIQIVPFSNQTLEPRLGDAVTAQMRKQLQRDGTYRLATHEDGDILVSGVITHYGPQEVS